jgi:hypothetical protein
MDIKPWIKYHRPECQLQFEFGRDGVIDAVAFMPAGWRPGEQPEPGHTGEREYKDMIRWQILMN